MRILFATGGTAGHINPALAVASYIRETNKDAEIMFIGTADHMESRLVPNAGFDFKTIEISGFRRSLSPKAIIHNIKTVIRLVKSSSASRKIIKDFNPDVVVGFGGYVSGPVLQQAVKLSIPTCIHEQNAFPGITNKTLAKQVDRVMLTVEDAKKHLEPKNEVVVTGLPVRGELLSALFTLLRQSFQRRDRHGEELDDDGGVDIRGDTHCEQRGVRERAAGQRGVDVADAVGV